MKDINKFKLLSDRFNTLLETDRLPVGVKFYFSEQEYNKCDVRSVPNRMSYCIMVKHAANGKGFKAHLGHMACMGGAVALGLSKPTEEMNDGTRRMGQGAYKDMVTCRKESKQMVYCKHTAYGVSVVPLEKCEEEPDIVLIITNPFNAMRISQGYAYHYAHMKDICFSGMQAICQECTSRPYETDMPNFSMMCSGTRMLAGWKKDELGIGIPFHTFECILDGIDKTVNPLERNREKMDIAKRHKKYGIKLESVIKLNSNYDDNCYIGGKTGLPGK